MCYINAHGVFRIFTNIFNYLMYELSVRGAAVLVDSILQHIGWLHNFIEFIEGANKKISAVDHFLQSLLCSVDKHMLWIVFQMLTSMGKQLFHIFAPFEGRHYDR